MKFHRVVFSGQERVLAHGRYVFYDYFAAPQPDGRVGTLVDQQTGQRRMISVPPGCGSSVLMGGPWLLFSCFDQQDQQTWLGLYALATGASRSVAVPQHPCYGPTPGYCWENPVRVGAAWIEFSESDCYHCTSSRRFENIRTGATRGDPTTATTIPDLDRPGLVRKICAPLRVPVSVGNGLPHYESFEFFGRYGVAYQPRVDPGKPGPWEGDYIQRCGTRTRGSVGALGNAHLLLFNGVAQNQLSGLFLPNGPRFNIPLPPGVADRIANGPGDVGLSDRTLFIGTENVATPMPNWVARLPTKPPPKRRRR